ncbi:hypothetical protein JX265_002658 [Neoarthrinium moseri]|uniref:FAD-binding domain-containing protein n=1 Tax=Neoarthrinium moseri TaxID=1658444 RepID=A0A9Q0AT76_9PEZI|nr:uncharacterized protein JN550_000470 [Neoarthrinium moseri]KAI1842805.1 hypothetical protein JX266_010981 [Neoarthrinium moseri]KAI1878288.1 hypothetical protein JN550_000470 [Neoarthrinium moseri]KAI1879704.1 hypothetical protein JX265_002658 [Neoarthrinium moseri]
MSDTESRFRVIVIGGGIAGLSASHMLQKAGIDHIVLERRSEVARLEGGSMFIYPHGSRILDQLGCLDTVQKGTVPPGRWFIRLPGGKKILESTFFSHIQKNHGYNMLIFERPKLLRDLYETLPDKTRVRTNASVDSIKQDENGVDVVLSNGEVERGDLVLGCDGVYSTVRSAMWDAANAASPGMITVKEKRAISADWYCLVFVTPGIPELSETDMTVINSAEHTHLFTLTPKKGFFSVYFLLDKPFPWPKRAKRFTEQDAEDLARSVADHPLSDTVMFGEVWKRRLRSSVIHLEEGVLDHWYHGRIALAGDSAHKVMPNMGLGGNSSMESVAVLTNRLRQMLVDTNWRKPSSAKLEETLAAYQEERVGRMKHIFKFSSNMSQGWRTPWYKFLSTWIIPVIPDSMLAAEMSKIISGAPRLDFLEVKDLPPGRVPWEYVANKKRSTEGGIVGGNKLSSLSLVTALGVALYYYYGVRPLPLPSLA